MFNKLLNDKKKLLFVLVGVAIVVVVLFLIIMGIVNNTDEKNFKKEYEKLNNVAAEDGKKYPRVSISEDNKIKYASYDEVLGIFDNMGDAVVYFGYAECLYCRTAVQVLLDTADNTELNEIYYLNVEESFENDRLLNILGDNLLINEDDEKKIYAPLVIFISDGKIVSYNKGTLSSHVDPYDELDKSQIRGLSEIYKYGIRDVLNTMNNN